jgi:hypothetical protein
VNTIVSLGPIFLIFLLIVVFRAIYSTATRTQHDTPVDSGQLLSTRDSWQAPDELVSLPVPRKVTLSKQGWGLVGINAVFVVAFGFFGLFSLQQSLQTLDRYERLQREGVHAMAIITHKKYSSGRKRTNYYLYYQYEVQGRTFQASASVGWNAYSSAFNGQSTSITYLPTDPSIQRLDIQGQPNSPWTNLVIFLGPLIFVFATFYRIRLDRELLANGEALCGMVTGNRSIKGGVRVSYQFLNRLDQIVSGSSTASKDVPGPGSRVTILALPSNQDRNSLYPLQNVRLDGYSRSQV